MAIMAVGGTPVFVSGPAGPAGLNGAAGQAGARGADGGAGPAGAPGLIQSVNGHAAAAVTLTAADVGAIAAGREAVADADYAAVADDVYIGLTALTAPRTITLPAAAAYRVGQALYVADESEACSETLAITVVPAGSDRIAGMSANAAILSSPGAKLVFHSNGSNLWTVA